MNFATIISPKKLIEVALPLDAINEAAKDEKAVPRRGHPQTLHLWWARRPLAAARAVIFSQLVHDPEDLWRYQNPGVEPNQQVKGHWTKARAKLFTIIEELVRWENTTNETVLEKAREEIRKAWQESCELNQNHPQAKELFDPQKMPGLHDPFAGGGTIPLEAQRLGLEAYASDLNPVAVLINKAMIEIPSKFAGHSPVNPKSRNDKGAKLKTWHGPQGMAEDVRYYGQWMRDEAQKRIGHLYPQIEITKEVIADRPDLAPYVGDKLTVVAWLWARTVKSPNPAFSHIDVPLASTFILNNKPGREAYVHPVIESNGYRLTVKIGKPSPEAAAGTKAAKANFRCIISDVAIDLKYIRREAQAGRMGSRLMAIMAEGSHGRVYLPPIEAHADIARSAKPSWKPELKVTTPCHDIDRLPMYGMDAWGDAFTARQLVSLTTFSDLVAEARDQIHRDAITASLSDDDIPLDAGGIGLRAYLEAISTYLACAVSRLASYNNSICVWNMKGGSVAQIFARQAIPMSWDFIEVNPLVKMSGNWDGGIEWIADVLPRLPTSQTGTASQSDASNQTISANKFISTDPPYYDNIGYADLSDFFYVWMRRSLRSVYPNLFATIAVPKEEELVATPYRHGTKDKAEKFFLDGMTQAMHNLSVQAHPSAPITIYYAFKQSETAKEGTTSTGWDVFLSAVLKSGFSITGTWPMRTERPSGVKVATNALASSIILVCRPRRMDAETISRRQFVRMLNEALPVALDAMTRESEGLHSPVAPVDLSQAIIGPGMAIFSRYDAVLEADGNPMTVKTALQLINRFLAEDDFDHDTQFCLRWFEQHHWDAGQFGEADVLARAKGTSVEGVKQSGVVFASGGQVRLIRPADYPADWNPANDSRLPIWEALHQLIRIFRSNGETGAGEVLAQIQAKAEATRQLSYRLYTLCERANLAEDARAYNDLITSWTGIESVAAKEPASTQRTLFDN